MPRGGGGGGRGGGFHGRRHGGFHGGHHWGHHGGFHHVPSHHHHHGGGWGGWGFGLGSLFGFGRPHHGPAGGMTIALIAASAAIAYGSYKYIQYRKRVQKQVLVNGTYQTVYVDEPCDANTPGAYRVLVDDHGNAAPNEKQPYGYTPPSNVPAGYQSPASGGYQAAPPAGYPVPPPGASGSPYYSAPPTQPASGPGAPSPYYSAPPSHQPLPYPPPAAQSAYGYPPQASQGNPYPPPAGQPLYPNPYEAQAPQNPSAPPAPI